MTTTPTQAVEPVCLTVRDVAALLQVSTRQVWRMVSSGNLPKPRRVGSRPRWDRATVLEWWQQQGEG